VICLRKKILTCIFIILIIFLLIFIHWNVRNKQKISYEATQKLMQLLYIENSSSFLPISINTVDLGFGDTTECYVLKFEISIEDYNENSLDYNDIDTTENSLNWKEKKDEQTYICYVREWEENEHRKDLFNELKKLKEKY